MHMLLFPSCSFKAFLITHRWVEDFLANEQTTFLFEQESMDLVAYNTENEVVRTDVVEYVISFHSSEIYFAAGSNGEQASLRIILKTFFTA